MDKIFMAAAFEQMPSGTEAPYGRALPALAKLFESFTLF